MHDPTSRPPFLFCFLLLCFLNYSKVFSADFKNNKKQGKEIPSCYPCPKNNLQCTPQHTELYLRSCFQTPERKSRYVGWQALWWMMSIECFAHGWIFWLFSLGSCKQQIELCLTPRTRLLSYAEPFFMPATWEPCPADCPWTWAAFTQGLGFLASTSRCTSFLHPPAAHLLLKTLWIWHST